MLGEKGAVTTTPEDVAKKKAARLLEQLTKTVLTETTGPVGIDVPRDGASTFEPQIVEKRQRRSGVAGVILSLYAKASLQARFQYILPIFTGRRSKRSRSAA